MEDFKTMPFIMRGDVWAFLSDNNLSIYISDRGEDFRNPNRRFYCTAYHVYTGESAHKYDCGVCIGETGDGPTPEAAFRNFFEVYAGQNAWFGRSQDSDKTIFIQFPILLS